MIDRDVIETAIALLAAYVFADFLLQVRWIIEKKRRPRAFLTHVAIFAATTVLLLGAWSTAALTAVAIIAISHAVIDWGKLWQSGKPWVRQHPRGELILFLVDQLLHILVIVLTAWHLREAWNEGWWSTLPAQSQTQFLTVLCASTGFILTTRTGSFIIELFMHGFQRSKSAPSSSKISGQINSGPDNSQKSEADKGLMDGGKWIGLLERALIFVLIMAAEFQAIGFLIAAKSILRFQYAKERSHSETVIIGTLASFGWAIVISLATTKAIGLVQ
jgi:hypothetical protein